MKKTLPENNCSTMKFFHQSLKSRKLLKQMKDLHIKFLNYLIKIKINQNHTDVLLNLMPLCFQKTFFLFVFFITSHLQHKLEVSVQMVFLNKRKIKFVEKKKTNKSN